MEKLEKQTQNFESKLEQESGPVFFSKADYPEYHKLMTGETEEVVEDDPWYATLAGLVASFGTGYVISNIIKNISTTPSNLGGKILMAIGSAAISGAISNFVSRETEKDVSSIASFVSKMKQAFRKE